MISLILFIKQDSYTKFFSYRLEPDMDWMCVSLQIHILNAMVLVDSHCRPGRALLPWTGSASTLILGFPASRTINLWVKPFTVVFWYGSRGWLTESRVQASWFSPHDSFGCVPSQMGSPAEGLSFLKTNGCLSIQPLHIPSWGLEHPPGSLHNSTGTWWIHGSRPIQPWVMNAHRHLLPNQLTSAITPLSLDMAPYLRCFSLASLPSPGETVFIVSEPSPKLGLALRRHLH